MKTLRFSFTIFFFLSVCCVCAQNANLQAEEFFNKAEEYSNGLNGCEKNATVAKEFYHKAADLNHPAAQYNLYRIYFDENPDEAFKWLTKSAEQRYADAMGEMGNVHYMGLLGQPKDAGKALDWYKMAVEAGSPEATYTLARIYFDGQYVERDVNYSYILLEKSAELNYHEAMYVLATHYEQGIYFEHDTQKALYWYEKAAIEGNLEARAYYGYLLLHGVYGEKETEKGLILLENAAENGHPLAMYELAICYYYGSHGLGLDRDKAKQMLVLSSKRGCADASLFLADVNDDVNWYLKAADQGSLQAEAMIAYYMILGKHVQPDKAQGIAKLEALANQNVPRALALMADIYKTGTGVKRDKTKAIEYARAVFPADEGWDDFYAALIATMVLRDLGVE